MNMFKILKYKINFKKIKSKNNKRKFNSYFQIHIKI